MERKLRLILAATASLVALNSALQAAQITWTGPASGGSWETGTNWSTGSMPAATDEAVFDADASVTVSGTQSVSRLSGAGVFTLAGGTLSVAGSYPAIIQPNGMVVAPGAVLMTTGADRSQSQVLTINGTLDLNGTGCGLGYLAGSGTVQNAGASTELVLDMGADTTSTFSGSITGAQAVTFRGGGAGAGRQVLTGASTYTSITQIGTFGIAGWANVEVQLAGGDNRLPTGTSVFLGNSAGAAKAKLILGDASTAVNQTVPGLYSYAQTGAAAAVVGGSASVSKLTIASGSAWDYLGVLGGSGANENNLALGKSGAGTLTLYGINTYAGDTTVTGGTLALADNAGLRFVIGANGVNNKITGAGTASLAGDFTFDLAAADTTVGDSWTIVDSASKSFAATFSIVGFTDAGNDTWTKSIDASRNYVFSESTGVLSVVPVPEPAAAGLMALCALVMIGRRK